MKHTMKHRTTGRHKTRGRYKTTGKLEIPFRSQYSKDHPGRYAIKQMTLFLKYFIGQTTYTPKNISPFHIVLAAFCISVVITFGIALIQLPFCM